MFEKLKSLFQQAQTEPSIVTTVTSDSDYDNLPSGFFIVQPRSGPQTLGFHDPQTKFTKWDVGTTVVVGARRITLDPAAKLPTVRRTFTHAQPGVTRAGNQRLLDTDSLEWDGEVGWDKSDPNKGWV